ncbi:MAG: hypothetical protein ACRD35_04285, partial [Candidatus Acidiferrales bacterium]
LWTKQLLADKAEKDSPGVKPSMREAEREQLSGKTDVLYQLTASGFPAGKQYVLWAKRLLASEPEIVAAGFQVDPEGRAVCTPRPAGLRRARRWLPWCADFEKSRFGLDSPRAGQPFRLGLISSDLAIRGFAKEIPIPIEAQDGPCRLSVELASPTGEAFAVWGEGFPPGEEIVSSGASDADVIPEYNEKAYSKAPDTGKILWLVSPAVVGKQSGWYMLTVTGKSCKVTVKFQWGPPAMQVQ